MIIGVKELSGVLEALAEEPALSLDTETTGLKPYHGHLPFSLIIADETSEYYFNFKDYADQSLPNLLGEIGHIRHFLASFKGLWFLQNAKFDMHHLHKRDCHLNPESTVHDTKSVARLLDSHLPSYSLDYLAETYLGTRKDDAVKKFVMEHKLYTWVDVPGVKTRQKDLHYDQVPWRLIVPYGEKDARLTYELGVYQRSAIQLYDAKQPEDYPRLWELYRNEMRLTRTVWKMECRGVLIDPDYCQRAMAYEQDRMEKAEHSFKRDVGVDFKSSGKLLAEVFEGENFSYTPKSNPTFTSDVLAGFDHPAAKHVIQYRDAKARSNFFANFLYQADSDNLIHTNFQQEGTATGRFCSSSPNLQNITKEKELGTVIFPIRRAIVPRPGKCFYMLDYDQVEYRLMLEYAKPMELINAVNDGLDVHEATARRAGISRSQAKTINFTMLYGGGMGLIAKRLGITRDAAQALVDTIFDSAPEIRSFMSRVKHRAGQRGYVVNWLGRNIRTEKNHAAVNYLIQGGCADVLKLAMNAVDEFLHPYSARLVLTIHDELVIEGSVDDAHLITDVERIMRTSYPSKYVPLTVGIDHSTKSLADKSPGLPAD